MENIESSQQGNKRGKVKNNSAISRRVWQQREEDVLMATMMELISLQWRNENEQFKPGFYAQLEMKLKIKFPETDLCANPHIESKVRLWKRHYYAVLGMLQTSGFGWNDTDKTINVESDQVWENYLKKDPSAKGLRNKPFPYYDNWCILFGKDRATGNLAEGPEETVNAMNEEEIQTNDGPFPTHSPADYSANISTPIQTGCSSRRKRSRGDRSQNGGISAGLASLAGEFGNFFQQTSSSMNMIAQRIGYEQDLSESRKKVYNELLKVPLDITTRLKAGSMICKDADKVDYFFSLPEEDRVEWVYMLLAGAI